MINVTRSSMPEMDEYFEEIKDLWDSRWLTNMGVKHQKLEAELEKYLGVEHIKLFTNGHFALESIIKAYDLQGEVITTPFTFASTTHAIVRNGLKPVFCDIRADDYTLDPNQIETLITEKTSAIVPVHVYGNICDVIKIEEIAEKYNLKVIYDAAHAFGETFQGKGIGNFGDAAMFSFHATKVFHTIEGGAVVYKDNSLSDKLNYLKNFGITGPESVVAVGGNAKMNEFQAAMGICNLRHIDEEIAKRKNACERYFERLGREQGIKLNYYKDGLLSNYAYFPIVCDGQNFNRDEIFEALKKQNIIARKYFYPLVNDFECYANRYNSKGTPIAKQVADNVLTLPLYAGLTISEVDKICDVILQTKMK